MSGKTRVAVLIGARGRAGLLDRTLWTLTNQTHSCITYVADDGTDGDSVADVCRKYGWGRALFTFDFVDQVPLCAVKTWLGGGAMTEPRKQG